MQACKEQEHSTHIYCIFTLALMWGQEAYHSFVVTIKQSCFIVIFIYIYHNSMEDFIWKLGFTNKSVCFF